MIQLSSEFVQAVVNYLETKPYQEVFPFFKRLDEELVKQGKPSLYKQATPEATLPPEASDVKTPEVV